MSLGLLFWCQDGKGFPVITFNLILGPVIASEAQNLQRNGCRNGGLAKVEEIRCHLAPKISKNQNQRGTTNRNQKETMNWSWNENSFCCMKHLSYFATFYIAKCQICQKKRNRMRLSGLFFDMSDCHKIGKKKFLFAADIHHKRTIAT